MSQISSQDGAGSAATAESRDRWSSRTAFTIAAIGSAVGLGNLWRYPATAFEFGGAAFLVPYIISLLFMGIPLLSMELALGQSFQTGDVGCYATIHKRFVGVGCAAMWGSFWLSCYYLLLLGWAVVSFVRAFEDPVPWVDPGEALRVFVEEVAQMGDPAVVTLLNWQVLLGMLFCWVLVYLSIFRGVFITGRVTYFTMALPFILIIVLAVAGGTLEGAQKGIDQYIGVFDPSEMTSNPAVWSSAVSQTFFSTSVAWGIMTAYGSHNRPGQNCSLDSVVIVTCDFLVSFIAGFAVFTVLGFVANQSGVEVTELAYSGAGLVYATLPVGLSQLPVPQLWTVLLFVTLLLLGIDSAFSILESVVTPFCDSIWFRKTPRWKVVSVLTAIGVAISFIFATDIGPHLLDIIDKFLSHFFLQAVALVKVLAVGWFWKNDELVEKVGKKTLYWTLFGWWGAAIIGCMVGFSLQGENGRIAGPIVFLVLMIVGFAAAIFSCPADLENRVYWTIFGSCELARRDINAVVGSEPTNCFTRIFSLTRYSIVWTIFIRFIQSGILLLLISLDFSFGEIIGQHEVDGETVGVFGDFPLTYSVVAGLIAFIPYVIVLAGAVFPDVPIFRGFMLGIEAKEAEFAESKAKQFVEDDSSASEIEVV